jgi:4'-phosphopantetheinyl transferase
MTDALVPLLVPGVCQVWWVRADDARPEHDELLAPADLARRARLRRELDRRRVTAATATLRLLLGAHRGLAPADLAIDRTCRSCGEPHGRPRLRGGPEFSVSHAGDRAVVALAVGPAIGVDAERVARIADHGLADLSEFMLAPEERTAQPVTAWALAMYWVRKEAVVKATGEGLARELVRVVVSPPSSPARVLSAHAGPVSLCDLHAPPGLAAALAVLGPPQRVEEYDAGPLLAQSSRRLSAATTRSQR